MDTLRTLIGSNIKMFVRNKQSLFFTLFMPVIIMSVFGLIGFDRVAKIDVGLALNAPPTQGTKAFIEQMKNVQAFNVHEGTETGERQAITEGDRAVVLLVPYDLIPEAPSEGRQAVSITVLTNGGEQQQANTAVSILNQFLDKTQLNFLGAPPLFNLEVQEVNSRNLTYFDFLLPGVVALAIMQMSVFSVSFVFADYKEKGVLKRLIATPMKPWQFVAANVFTRLLVAVVQAAVLIAIGVLVFKASVVGSYLLVLPVVLLGAIMFLGLGFVISGIANTVESVPAIANLVVFPMLFLGGTFFPTSTMPDWLQQVVRFMPLTYLTHSLREIMTRGAGLSDVGSDLLWMAAWSVVLVALANYAFRFEEKRI